MIVDGSILIDSEGANSLINSLELAEETVADFIKMCQVADNCNDKLYYINNEDWAPFWIAIYAEESRLAQSISQCSYQALQCEMRLRVLDQGEFETKNEPRTHGGFKCQRNRSDSFVYDEKTIVRWHNQWFLLHPEKIDWEESPNNLFPCYEAILLILQRELEFRGKRINANSQNLVNVFHEEMKHLSPTDRISCAKRIGTEICVTNYYNREMDLEALEARDGNNRATQIFSLLRGGRYQFISIDTQHCMFELCDDNGDHIGEYRFDGSPNGDYTREEDHGLMRVREWKVHHNR